MGHVTRDGNRAEPSRAARRAVFVAALLAFAFLVGTTLAPWLQNERPTSATLLRLAYAPLCHQLPERSLVIGSAHQAVCARCSGLYLGGVAGLVIAGVWVVGRRSPSPIWLAVAVVPTLIDAVLPFIGLPGLTNLPRLLVAAPSGFAAGLFLAIGIYDLFAWPARFESHALTTPAVSHALEE